MRLAAFWYSPAYPETYSKTTFLSTSATCHIFHQKFLHYASAHIATSFTNVFDGTHEMALGVRLAHMVFCLITWSNVPLAFDWIESLQDEVIIDCPPSLPTVMDFWLSRRTGVANSTHITGEGTLYLLCLRGSLLKCDSCHDSNWWHPCNSLTTGLSHSMKCNVLQDVSEMKVIPRDVRL